MRLWQREIICTDKEEVRRWHKGGPKAKLSKTRQGSTLLIKFTNLVMCNPITLEEWTKNAVIAVLNFEQLSAISETNTHHVVLKGEKKTASNSATYYLYKRAAEGGLRIDTFLS